MPCSYVGPFGGFHIRALCEIGIIRDFSNRVLISFYLFYRSLELSFLHRFDLSFRNLIFNLEGQNSLFYPKSGHNFQCYQNPSKVYFMETRYFAERFCLFCRFRLKSRSRCFEPGHSLSGGTHLNPIGQKLFKQVIPSPIAQSYASSGRREREFQ